MRNIFLVNTTFETIKINYFNINANFIIIFVLCFIDNNLKLNVYDFKTLYLKT